METSAYQVETYNLTTATGRHIRKATKVICPSGEVIHFIERMRKGEAVRNARYQESVR